MNLKSSNKTNIFLREWLTVVLKSIIFAICAGALTTLVHMLCDRYVLHIHGKPESLSTALTIYSACEKILISIGYYVLGRKIPIKNSILRSMTYIGLNWLSNFMPQFMGLAFADGAIAEQTFRISDLVCDTIVSILLGIILGVLFRKNPNVELRNCDKSTYRKTIAISTIVFPILVLTLDQLVGFIYPAFSCFSAMQISEQAKIPFYINFYSWFLVSVAFIAVFYRLTEYNDNSGWCKFALKYSLLLWTPVVMIMVVFGTDLIATTVFSLLFIICIFILCRIINTVMESQSKAI